MPSPATAKRRHGQLQQPHDELVVDDLLFASTFASIPPGMVVIPGSTSAAQSTTTTTTVPVKADDNEIEVEDDDEESAESENNSDGKESDEENYEDHSDSDADDDDDDEEEEDLKEALERMEAVNEDEDFIPSSAPKTENEVDGYNVPIQELESKLQLKLTVGGENAPSTALDDKQVVAAGTIKNFMVESRTLVVESVLPSPSSNWQQQTGPLDEGSLLVIKVPTLMTTHRVEDNSQAVGFVPLGRIFEVFGPVSRPLYTIRLPSPNDAKAQSSRENKKGNNKVDGTAQDTASKYNDKTSPEVTEEGKAEKKEDAAEPQVARSDTSKATDQTPKGAIPTVDDIKTNESESLQQIKDPWSPEGVLTKYLSQNPSIQVFYVQDEAKLIDTGLILRSSGKGCDASNLYDEEVMNSNEMYYSDDEKERKAKNKRKSGRRKGGGAGGNKQNSRNQSQHQYNGNQTYPVPQGFHVISQQTQQQQFYPQHQQLHYGQPPMPPPPPPYPGQSSMRAPYFGQPQPSYYPQQVYPVGMVPPPPPPPPPPGGATTAHLPGQPPSTSCTSMSKSPNEPPAYQY